MSLSDMNTVTLHDPIEDNGETIKAVKLIRPNSGNLRGLKLLDLAQMDVSQVEKLLPRITRPALSPDAVRQLDPVDLMRFAGKISGFFFTQEAYENEKAAYEAEIEEAEFLPSPEAGKAAG